MRFDRFDICEAYWLLAIEWGGGMSGLIPGTKVSTSRLRATRFSPRLSLRDFDSLTDNGKDIYNAFVRKHRLCSGCEGSCWDTGMSCDMAIE